MCTSKAHAHTKPAQSFIRDDRHSIRLFMCFLLHLLTSFVCGFGTIKTNQNPTWINGALPIAFDELHWVLELSKRIKMRLGLTAFGQ